MADTKISALTALTGANVDETADVLPIVDTSVTTTKKILVSELFTLTGASPQITLGKLNTTSGGIKFFGSTSGNVTLAPNVAAGASVTVTLPATSVTLNAAGDLTGTTLAAGVVTTSITTVGALNSGSITSGFGSIDVGADAISGGAITGTGNIRTGTNGTGAKFMMTNASAAAASFAYMSSAERIIMDESGFGIQMQNVMIGTPTGTYPGAGSLNVATDVFKNNNAYTNPDYVLEHWATGKIIKFADNEGAQSYNGLQPLSTVVDFMRTNHVLPRIHDWRNGKTGSKGLFGGGDALLASIEEGYLYLADHESRLRTLEARLQ